MWQKLPPFLEMFNVILDANLDGSGGKPQVKESCKQVEDLCSAFDLIDIYGDLEIRMSGALHGDRRTQ